MTSVPANFVVETKFDGWRVCTHVGDSADASTISMHGRSAQYSSAMDEKYAFNVLHPLIMDQVAPPRLLPLLARSSSSLQRAAALRILVVPEHPHVPYHASACCCAYDDLPLT